MKRKGYKPKKQFTMKQKIIGMGLCILLYRMLSFIPLPFVERDYIRQAVGANGSLGFMNILSGGGLGNMSFTALGIGPWITASIVLQLAGMLLPKLQEMGKDEDGKKKYKQITFGLAAALGFFESLGMMIAYGKMGYLSNNVWYAVFIPSLLMMAGTGILSLMAWYIDGNLFGNGTSVILTAGILSSYVGDGAVLGALLSYGKGTGVAVLLCTLAFLFLCGMFVYAVFISSCEKRIPVIYSGKIAGKSAGTDIPVKLILGGVVPVIFASTFVTFPAFIGSLFGSDAKWLKLFDMGCWLTTEYPWASAGFFLYLCMIVLFGYFCQIMYLNPIEIADNLKKQGGTIPGIRAGKPTSDYISGQAKWLTGLGGLCLCVIAAAPIIVSGIVGVSNLSFLGTSVLIVVGTLDECWKIWRAWKKERCYAVKGSVTKGRIF